MDQRFLLRDLNDSELVIEGLSCYVTAWIESIQLATESLAVAQHDTMPAQLSGEVYEAYERLDILEEHMTLVIGDLEIRKRRLRESRVGLADVHLEEKGSKCDSSAHRDRFNGSTGGS